MSKAISMEDVDAVIHSRIAANLKSIAKLRKCEDEGEVVPKAIETLEQCNKELEAFLKR